MPKRKNRLRRLPLVSAVVASLLFGSLVGVAAATHWHSTSGLWHGFVHFSSTTDGHFAARVDYSTGLRGCQIDSLNNPGGYRTEYESDSFQLCNVDSGEVFQSATECKYRAENYSEWAFTWHHNYPENYCG